MLRLFTSYYNERQPARRAELDACLQANLALPAIDEVCLLVENCPGPGITDSKLTTIPISTRPTYQAFFDHANARMTSPGDVTIVANSDLYFDRSLTALARVLQPGQCAALSRWDVSTTVPGRNTLFDRNDSQDAWVFRGPIRNMSSDFLVGIPRCDNRILFELQQAGYDVINPAFSIRVCHLHAGERGEYPGAIDGPHVPAPYAYLWPHNLHSLPATIVHWISHPHDGLGWRPDWRWLASALPVRALRRLMRSSRPAAQVPSSQAGQ
jgi:hypothetical protein